MPKLHTNHSRQRHNDAEHRDAVRYKRLFNQRCKVMYGAYQLANIAHFIIVPANGFNQLFIAGFNYPGLSCIKQAAVRNADHIAAHNFIFGINQSFRCWRLSWQHLLLQ